MEKIIIQRMRNGYRNLNYHNFIVIIPKCKLYEKMFNYTIIDWDSYRVTCIELLALLKAWQFQQTNGLEWFCPNEEILDNYIPEWRLILLELIKLKIVEVNPYNSKLNFKDNRTRYQRLPINSAFKERLKRLEELLVQIDFEQYNASLRKRNQNKLRLSLKNFKSY
jgi:hypothetical protein